MRKRPENVTIYFMQIKNPDGFIKIGHSINLKKRLDQIKSMIPYPLEIAFSFQCPSDRLPMGIEKAEFDLHKKFREFQIPNTSEWFYPKQELLNHIDSLKKAGGY